MSTPKLAIIGCGAIAEAFHLPALVEDEAVRERVILVDRNPQRAQAMAKKFAVPSVATDYHEILHGLDGAFVTVPVGLHHQIALDCVRAGVHVLCEKPLCEHLEQGQELVYEAERAGVTIAVNNTRRRYPSSMRVKSMITAGELGAVCSVDWEEGEPFGWPCASGSYFGAAAGGRGVIADKGAHVLDLMSWWLGGEPQLTGYADDAMGGTEAVAELTFQLGGVAGRVKLSWFNKLRNTFRVVGEGAVVEGKIYDRTILSVTPVGGRPKEVRLDDPSGGNINREVVGNFLDVVRGAADPLVPAASVLPSLALIDDCYAHRTPFQMPWNETIDRILDHV